MSAEATNRIYDPAQDFVYQLKYAIRDYEAKKRAAAKRKSWYLQRKPTYCSQCKKMMDKKIADLQIENKRENAPICTACICGAKRK